MEINWASGLVGEKEGVEPSLLYRPKGMPAPFLATVINAALLFGILYSVGKKPVLEALKKRKAEIVAGIDEASRMKAEAAARLAEYEAKLAGLDAEIERIRAEMREAVEAERRRILSEAKERRERMERDARILVEQELKAAREALVRETVASAMVSATRLLGTSVGAPDHDRLAREYLDVVGRTALGTPGGPS
ncbi:MAG: ATP synthase F0 subunit B [Chloroflexi bacterium]|nr:ATP synthase F0 subunit B [Chloroflexota bacterium]